MSELESIKKEILIEFCALQEFQAFTVLAYKDAGEIYSSGARTLHKLTMKYSDFASHLGIDDIAYEPSDISYQYTKVRDGYLYGLIHQYQINLFEIFFFKIIRFLLLENPKSMGGSKKLEYRNVTASKSLDEVVEYMVQREINELKYKNVSQWFNYLESLVSKCRIEPAKIQSISETKVVRDVLVHNAGIVSQTYMDKAGSAARFSLGDEIILSGEETRANWVILVSVLFELIDHLREKKSINTGISTR